MLLARWRFFSCSISCWNALTKHREPGSRQSIHFKSSCAPAIPSAVLRAVIRESSVEPKQVDSSLMDALLLVQASLVPGIWKFSSSSI
jgi:hypothetical protein